MQLVDPLLLVVSTGLGVVDGLLGDVLIGLGPVKPSLAVIEHAGGRFVIGVLGLALAVKPGLVLFDASLVAIAEQLLAIAENLLEVGEALLLGEPAVGIWLVVRSAHSLLAESFVVGHSSSIGAGRPIQKPWA